ncbi:MAG: hypothetical protein JW953_07620 [Anaerolineae bacterium]|nr:hypothetical protein [Anaerolineae bacterium]
MDTLQVIALIIIALVILAVIIAFRQRLGLSLKFLGLDVQVEAENEGRPPQAQTQPPPPAGVRVKDAKATAGGLLIEEGQSAQGTGIDVEGVEVKDDIVIGKGQSGSPKDRPLT